MAAASHNNSRRRFLQGLLGLLGLSACKQGAGPIPGSPVACNTLRPPGAVKEEAFAGTCIRCGRCVEICPYRCIKPLDVRSGVQGGTPIIRVQETPCYLCMKCVVVCPTGALKPVEQTQTRMGLAVVDKHSCISWDGKGLCRTCYNVCPYPDKAIRLDEFRPVVDRRHCTGCGICTHGCPITRKDGGKAINIQPIYAQTYSLPEDTAAPPSRGNAL